MSSSASSGGDVTASSGYDEWDNAISNLINANYKTDQARNYIQQFVWFEYRNWTNTPPNKQMFRNNALNVSHRKIGLLSKFLENSELTWRLFMGSIIWQYYIGYFI